MRPKITKNNITGISAVLLFAAFVFFYPSGERNGKILSETNVHSYMEGIRMVTKVRNSDSWVITADRADFSQDNTNAIMDSVEIQMPGRGVVVNAGRASFNTDTKKLRLDDNIKISTKDYTVSAEGLSWNPETEELISDSRVSIDGKRFRIEGEGVSTDEGHRIRLMKNVKASFF